MATVLVTGATGYIGGRLVPELLKKGHSVRCLARTPDKLNDMPWREEVEVVKGDVSDAESLKDALKGIDAAYYLVHSMTGSGESFSTKDRQIARTFRNSAAAAKVGRIIYLGGLGDDGDPNLSKHLSSRHEVGEVLADGPVPVTELRAAVIIGSGSASFEMLRTVVEVLPAMLTPRWVTTPVQPIAIQDVLFYLTAVLEVEATKGRVIEVGGPDVVGYIDLMATYAKLAKLRKRVIIKVPFMTVGLSAHWLGLVTPLPTSLAKALIYGLENKVVVTDPSGMALMPHTNISTTEAINRAIEKMLSLEVTTSWADAEIGGRNPSDPIPSDPEWSGGTVLQDVKEVTATVPIHKVYQTVTGIGGKRGWFVTDPLWAARGVIDKLVGGVGMRRGRRHPDNLRVGDALDFWRVESLKEDTILRLRAEMRLPGKAWLEWTMSEKNGQTRIKQWARFQPRGLAGRLYWYSLLPFHGIIFKGLLNQIVYRAQNDLFGAAVTGRKIAPLETVKPKG